MKFYEERYMKVIVTINLVDAPFEKTQIQKEQKQIEIPLLLAVWREK